MRTGAISAQVPRVASAPRSPSLRPLEAECSVIVFSADRGLGKTVITQVSICPPPHLPPTTTSATRLVCHLPRL